MQLNRAVTGPRNPGVIGDRSGSFSRESKMLTTFSWFFVSTLVVLFLLCPKTLLYNLLLF